MESLSLVLRQIKIKDFFDLFIVSLMFFEVFLIVQGTRAVQVLVGLALLCILYFVGIRYQLYALSWLLDHFFESFFVIFVILFQEQLRATLVSFSGSGKFWNLLGREKNDLKLEEVVEACIIMSKEKIGALIVFEKSHGLLNYIETGTKLLSQIHSDLLYAVFQSQSSLHDGAVIISKNQICAAGCFLPLSKNIDIDRHLGTRHRASLGISEVSDAVVVTVSEETGTISIAHKGKFYHCRSEQDLRQELARLMELS
jgi:diadenylate cyclase